jgi:putative acetyltransferase
MPAVIAIEPARQPEVIDLLRQSDEFHWELYPVEFCYLLDVSELEHPGITVFVARDEGSALGMAALVDRGDGTAEIKRMFVSSTARGLGIAGGLLRSLERHAASLGVRTIQLETGPLQTAALAVYARHGFERIPNFPPYIDDEFSICMEKSI